MAKLYGEIFAPDKRRTVSVSSDEVLHITLHRGNKRQVDIIYAPDDTVEVNGMLIELKE